MADEPTATATDKTEAAPGTGTAAPSPSAGEAANAAVTTPPADHTSGTSAGGDQETSDSPETGRTFTQAELNAIVKREAKKAAEAAKAELEKERADAELSEAERQKKRAEEAEKATEATRGKLRRLAILEAARDEAAKQKLEFAPGALADAYDLSLFADVETDEDGLPQTGAVSEAIKGLAKSRPHLLAQKPKPAAPDLDATRGGAGNPLDAPEAQQSRRNLTRGF